MKQGAKPGANRPRKRCVWFRGVKQNRAFRQYHVGFSVGVGAGTALEAEQISSVSTLHGSLRNSGS